LKSTVASSIALAIGISLLPRPASAADLRFDVSTSNNATQLPHLNFPSANGHIPLLGGSTYQSTVEANGNTLGIYYNNFNSSNPFTTYPNPHDMAVAIQTYVNQQDTTTSSRNAWIALNEISSSNWQNNPINANGIDYRTWCADVVALLKNGDSTDPSHIVPAHTGVIIWAPFGTPTGSNATSWAAIVQNGYIGVERYIDGPTVQADGYSVATVQSYYQASLNAWVNNEHVSPSRLMLTEEYTNSLAGNGFGANGLSGDAWREAIEVRTLAAYNVGFGGYIGYAWDKNAQGSDWATLQSYENAYASTLVVQTELPCWTGNNSNITGNTWSDYTNWTGGLPSTVNAPYPLLASANPNLPKQTAANFFSRANPSAPGITITLDGNQSITTMTFDSANPYTIAPGTGGTLSFTGVNSSITGASGSHFISADVALNNNLSTNLTGNLTLSGAFTTNGHTLTKSGSGTLTISGSQSHTPGSAIAVAAGTLNLNTDAGSVSSAPLAISVTGGSANFQSNQHLASLAISSGHASLTGTNHLLVTNALSITGPSQLDLDTNDMLVNYSGASPVSSIRQLIINSYGPGNWTGSTGITSTSAKNNPTRHTTLAYAESSALGISSFDGQPISGPAVVVKYTYTGDNNLDGVVDLDNDFSLFVDGYNKQLSNPGALNAGNLWINGDYNYDGVIDLDNDFSIFVDSYAAFAQNPTQLAQLGAIINSMDLTTTQKNALLSVVPEPGSLMLAIFAAGPMVMRRKRRSNIRG